jgi:hypothetical protein
MNDGLVSIPGKLTGGSRTDAAVSLQGEDAGHAFIFTRGVAEQLPRHGRQLRIQTTVRAIDCMAGVSRLWILLSVNGAPSSVARKEQHELEGAE